MNKEKAIEGIKNGRVNFVILSEALQNDKDVAYAAIKRDYNLIIHLNKHLKNDKQIMLHVLENNPSFYSLSFSGAKEAIEELKILILEEKLDKELVDKPNQPKTKKIKI